MLPLHTLYSQHAALSLEKQLALSEIIGDRDFSFDLHAGRLGFRDDLAFPMQVLGTVSRQTCTWLWAWASPQPLPEELVQAAYQLRKLGQTEGIGELFEEGFDLVAPPPPVGSLLTLHERLTAGSSAPEPLDGHLIAMLAAGVCEADAYYGADYGRGIAYVLLPRVPGIEAHRPDSPAAMAALFAELLQLPYSLHHRTAFGAYVQQKGYTAETNGRQVRGVKGKQTLVGTFDSNDRLTALEADGNALPI